MCKASEKQSHKNRHRSIVLVAKIGLGLLFNQNALDLAIVHKFEYFQNAFQ